MMIRIIRNENRITILFRTDLPYKDDEPESEFWFSRESSSAHEAELFRRYLIGRLGDLIASIRKEAYIKGWKDAKAKTKRATYFSKSTTNIHHVGW